MAGLYRGEPCRLVSKTTGEVVAFGPRDWCELWMDTDRRLERVVSDTSSNGRHDDARPRALWPDTTGDHQ